MRRLKLYPGKFQNINTPNSDISVNMKQLIFHLTFVRLKCITYLWRQHRLYTISLRTEAKYYVHCFEKLLSLKKCEGLAFPPFIFLDSGRFWSSQFWSASWHSIVRMAWEIQVNRIAGSRMHGQQLNSEQVRLKTGAVKQPIGNQKQEDSYQQRLRQCKREAQSCT